MNKIFNKKILILALIALTFFCGKWLISFIFFSQEDLILKVINESYQDSSMYFHYVKSFSDFNFNENYNSKILQDNFLAYPIGSILFHSILYKIFGITSFIILEFVSIFIFFVIFFYIFKQFKITDLGSIFLTSLIFILPTLISETNFLNIVEIETFAKNFYNLRFPRPLISQLYLFSFILILIISYRDEMFKLKYILPLSIIMGLTLSSFFFIFFTQFLSYIFLLIKKYKKNVLREINKNYKNIVISSLLFLIIITPFFILLTGTNDSYNSRMGIFTINIEDKLFLVKYYFEKLTRIKILILYSLIILLFYFHSKYIKKNNDIIDVFLIIFIASILSPILFIIISNKISFLYHFNNTVVITTFMYFIIFFISFLTQFFSKIKFRKINYFYNLGILIFLVFYNLNYNLINFNEISQNKNRNELNKVISLIKSNEYFKIKDLNILTFNNTISIWSILNDVKDLKIIDGTFSAKSNVLTEQDLLETFKFLKLNENDFEKFISNKKVGYRFINQNARQIFWQKYQANSLFTFKDSKDFDNETLKFIRNSSPFYSHQFAIPNFEKRRLINKYNETRINNEYNPDLIIIEKKREVINNSEVDLNKYCKVHDEDYYKLFFLEKYCKS